MGNVHEEGALGKLYDAQISRRLLTYVRPYWRMILISLGLTIIINLVQQIGPLLSRWAIDDYIKPAAEGQMDHGTALRGIGLVALAYITALVVTLVLGYFHELLLNTIGQKTMSDLRQQIFAKLQTIEVAYYDRTPVGRLMTRLTGDVDALSELFTSGLVATLGDVVLIVSAFGVMFYYNWRLALASLVFLPLLVAATAWFRRGTRSGFRTVRTKTARLNAFTQEHLSAMHVVQLFNREEKARAQIAEINKDHLNANLDTVFYFGVFYPLVNLIAAGGSAMIIWYGGGQVIQNAITVGTLVAFLQYTERLWQPIQGLSDRYNIVQTAIVASERIFELLDMPSGLETRAPRSVPAPCVSGQIEFRNVWFAYTDHDWVLKDVSFDIASGESLALVGHTGAGKTTLTNLLMRFYDVQRGQILLDGIDVRDWDIEKLRKNFAIVLQDIFLFSGDVASNIRLGDQTITDERVSWAAREVCADQFIEQLPGRYGYKVRERGAGLSVGQKQLISLARALAFDSRILILDEATSSIDTTTEHLIQQATTRVMRDRTSIIIAHRLSTIQQVDKIVVLHKGMVREIGSHQELLQQRGLYYKLYRLQYNDEEHEYQSLFPTSL
jgi:ATP-binding cassette, subfamily B, multidrug efflux pump